MATTRVRGVRRLAMSSTRISPSRLGTTSISIPLLDPRHGDFQKFQVREQDAVARLKRNGAGSEREAVGSALDQRDFVLVSVDQAGGGRTGCGAHFVHEDVVGG